VRKRSAPHRLLLVHWNAAEAEVRATELRDAGFEVACLSRPARDDLRALVEQPLVAALIDLRRVPSAGRDVGVYLRGRRATRNLPLVFVEADREKTTAVRRLLPDAHFTPWSGVVKALRAAIAAPPPPSPAVPGALSGYAGKALPKKLGLRENATITILGGPEGFEAELGPLPDGARLSRRATGGSSIAILFARSKRELSRRFPAAVRSMAPGGRLWIAWPKRASGVATDLTQAGVRAFGLAHGLVDYRIAALTPVWSGLCFARR